MAGATEAVRAPAGALSLGGILVLALGTFEFSLEQSIVVPALPAVAEHYDASLVATGWIVTGFLLSGIVAVPVLGRLGDLYGKRRLLLLALGAFAVGSLICAVADSIGVVIAGRIVQGIGAAVGPLSYGIAKDSVPPERLPRAIGVIVAGAMGGASVGYVLSGILVDRVSVTAVFWFLLAVGVVLGLAAIVLVPESRVRARARVDVWGAALLALGLAALLLAISKGIDWGWSSGRVLGLFAAAAALLGAFTVVERRAAQPLVDLGVVVRRPFANANLCAFAFGYAFFIVALALPFIGALPEGDGPGLGLSTTEIGLLLLPTGLASMAGGWAAGRWTNRIGARSLVAIGSALGIAAYAGLALIGLGALPLATASAVLGLSWGFILTGIYAVVVGSASADKSGVTVAVNVLIRNTAGALGAQIAFVILAEAASEGGGGIESGFTSAFVMGAVGAGVALVASTSLGGRRTVPRPVGGT
jgi:MFS family permease